MMSKKIFSAAFNQLCIFLGIFLLVRSPKLSAFTVSPNTSLLEKKYYRKRICQFICLSALVSACWYTCRLSNHTCYKVVIQKCQFKLCKVQFDCSPLGQASTFWWYFNSRPWSSRIDYFGNNRKNLSDI